MTSSDRANVTKYITNPIRSKCGAEYLVSEDWYFAQVAKAAFFRNCGDDGECIISKDVYLPLVGLSADSAHTDTEDRKRLASLYVEHVKHAKKKDAVMTHSTFKMPRRLPVLAQHLSYFIECDVLVRRASALLCYPVASLDYKNWRKEGASFAVSSCRQFITPKTLRPDRTQRYCLAE